MVGYSKLLNPEVSKNICKALEHGMPLKHAAAAVNVDETTVYRWLKKGSEPEKHPKVYATFARSVARARAKCLEKATKSIMKAAEGYDVKRTTKTTKELKDGTIVTTESEDVSHERDWRAAAFMAERQFPAEFGRKDRVEHSGNGAEPLRIVISRAEPPPGLNEPEPPEGHLTEGEEASDANA